MAQQRMSRDGKPWPPGVEPLPLDGFDMLGFHRETKALHWDGVPVITKHELGKQEFFLASIAAWATVAAAVFAGIALVVQIVSG
ncbi:hypothetical protein EDC40_103662 [Aminobacter aminovorans]|uniref:Uncharacterized protein n=1 Tax=Aminobacter aminovorans TaxID=83263 RepID=A0A380WMJ2_AMIAI|nr:hypothetical protein [Aminobacter aminovorans]TCS28194.1 hypothetical protein EDC40_103662 [Aminobacter aminovorans]SUU89394.1 Uncharacterised protein [Aminobacter aminovorans]